MNEIMNEEKIGTTQRTRMLASLIGGAVGDSLGADLEWLDLDGIRRRFPAGVADLSQYHGIYGAMTDDTQMTLFTAEGIIRAYEGAESKARYGQRLGFPHVRAGDFIQALANGKDAGNLLNATCHVHDALLRWLRTQTEPHGNQQSQEGENDAGLIADPRMWVRRAPGYTCMDSLRAFAERQAAVDRMTVAEMQDAPDKDFPTMGEPAKNDSKGCGTIMRVAPVALMVGRDLVWDMAMKTSALTHGHPTAQIAAAAWAMMLADVADGADIEESAQRTVDGIKGMKGIRKNAETVSAILAALKAPRDGKPETIERFLGEGWTAEEALSIALYACLCPGTVQDRLRIAVTHSGDSDSTGAIAGNMLGLMEPEEVLDLDWASRIECRDIIEGLVIDYCRFAGE